MYLDKKISIIVSVSDNGIISHKGELPWDPIPQDLERFNRLTMGASVVMGRKTLQAIGKPLDRRQNIILSKKGASAIEGVDLGGEQIWVNNSLRGAVGVAMHDVFVIGGNKAFKEALEIADMIYLTRVHQRCAGDKRFDFDDTQWDLLGTEDHDGFSFITYKRK